MYKLEQGHSLHSRFSAEKLLYVKLYFQES